MNKTKLLKDPLFVIEKFHPLALFVACGLLILMIEKSSANIPLIEKTIFLILASACFVKGSPRANEWLRNHKFLGAYLKNYQDKSGLTVNAKVINIAFLWIMISVSALLLTQEFYIQLLLFAIAIGVTIHLLIVKTKKV